MYPFRDEDCPIFEWQIDRARFCRWIASEVIISRQQRSRGPDPSYTVHIATPIQDLDRTKFESVYRVATAMLEEAWPIILGLHGYALTQNREGMLFGMTCFFFGHLHYLFLSMNTVFAVF